MTLESAIATRPTHEFRINRFPLLQEPSPEVSENRILVEAGKKSEVYMVESDSITFYPEGHWGFLGVDPNNKLHSYNFEPHPIIDPDDMILRPSINLKEGWKYVWFAMHKDAHITYSSRTGPLAISDKSLLEDKNMPKFFENEVLSFQYKSTQPSKFS